MKAVKDNKVYTISTETEADAYKARGFDIYDESGKVKAYASGKTVPYEKYAEMEKENAKLKKELKKLKEQKNEPEK